MSKYTVQNETKSMVTEIIDSGLPFPEMLEEYRTLQLPANLDDLSDIELGKHLSQWASIFSRAKFELAQAISDQIVLSAKKKTFKTKREASIPVKAKVTVEKAKIESDEYYLDLNTKEIQATVRIKLLEALCAGYDRKFSAISREIERRRQDKNKWFRGGTGT
jgi:hypothetical protein